MAETEEQYEGVQELFPYHNVELAASPFPKHFPFSGMVGQVYCQLEAFVRNCNDYADRLNLRLDNRSLFVECVLHMYLLSYPQSNGSV